MRMRCDETGYCAVATDPIDSNCDTSLGFLEDYNTSSNTSSAAKRMNCPDMAEEQKSRVLRTLDAIKMANPHLASQLCPAGSTLSHEEAAAINIQRHFRGYLGRREYLQRLYEQIAKEEATMMERQKEQLDEGNLLVESYRLERELGDSETLRRNHSKHSTSQAITIQRAWRHHKGNRRRPSEDGSGPVEFVSTQRVLDDAMIDRDDRCLLDDSLWLRHNDHSVGRHDTAGVDYDEDLSDALSSAMQLGCAFNREEDLTSYYDDEEDMTPTLASFALPSTDWSTIEAVLRTESGINSPDEDSNSHDGSLTSKARSGRAPHLQMVFVDDDSLASDTESEPDVKVYVYDRDDGLSRNEVIASVSRDEYARTRGIVTAADGDIMEDDQRHVDSRDSGCVPGDLIDLNIEHVTDMTRRSGVKGSSPEPAVESTRMLDTLLMHEEHERRSDEEATRRKRQSIAQDDVSKWSNRELELLREELERKLRDASDVLVEELRCRDVLHAEQDSLLVDVEDWTKMSQDSTHNPTMPAHVNQR